MKKLWLGLVAVCLFSGGVPSFAGDERNAPKSAEKAHSKAQVELKNRSARPKLDSAKMPVDPLEVAPEKLRTKKKVEADMPPDDFGKTLKEK